MEKKMIIISCFCILFLFNFRVESMPYAHCNAGECFEFSAQKELCDFCYILLPLTRRLIESNQTDHFRHIASDLCSELKIADYSVCNLAIKTYEVKTKRVKFN